jgi:hypothetical protein
VVLFKFIKLFPLLFSRSSLTNTQTLVEGIPGAFVTCVILAAHEAGHIYAAKAVGAKLGFPYFVPSLQVQVMKHKCFEAKYMKIV